MARNCLRKYRPVEILSVFIFVTFIFLFLSLTSKKRHLWFQSQVHPTENILDFATIQNLTSRDPELLRYIKAHHLFLPSSAPYNLDHPDEDPSEFKDFLRSFFRGKRDGVFIECGANDGEFFSNTLELERKLGWTGILIEANPLMIPKLLAKNRKAFIFDVGLSPSLHAERIEFLDSKGSLQWEKGTGKFQPRAAYLAPLYFDKGAYNSVGLVECFPLVSIMASLNLMEIDYFSLDVEGNEFQILKTIPFHLVNIKVIQVEHWVAPVGKRKIERYLLQRGYHKILETKSDFIFSKHGSPDLDSFSPIIPPV